MHILTSIGEALGNPSPNFLSNIAHVEVGTQIISWKNFKMLVNRGNFSMSKLDPSIKIIGSGFYLFPIKGTEKHIHKWVYVNELPNLTPETIHKKVNSEPSILDISRKCESFND